MSDCFFYYRLPGQGKVEGYRSGNFGEGFWPKTFIIAPFDTIRHPVIHIPAAEAGSLDSLNALASKALRKESSETQKEKESLRSTSREEHSTMIESVKEDIAKGNLEKCVISRAICIDGSLDVKATFKMLCKAYPHAYVFCYYTPITGLWMGASPELLLTCEGNTYRTVALAGTMEAESKEEWDEKNISEQRVVRDYIVQTFRTNGLETTRGETKTVFAGPVKHLRTEIIGKSRTMEQDGFQIALDLSPTPALSGYPKARAIEKISQLEKHDRSYYGGFVGMAKTERDCSFYVNLRSMRIFNDRYVLYCGGGIMKDSKAGIEWEETENKSLTLINSIIKI